MIVFRFKITFEDNDSFMREVELPSNQSFEDFHNIIIHDLKLDNNKGASFFLCDHSFRKQKEISLVDSSMDNNTDSDDADEQSQKRNLIMNEHSLSDLIDDPHQRLIYIFDYEKNWTFFLELQKILPVNSPEDYPKISKQSGGIPRELKPKSIKQIEDEPANEEQLQEQETREVGYPEIIEGLEDGFKVEDRPEDDSLEQDEPNDDKL